MRALEFDDVAHIYRVDGEIIPSVTQIIRDAGLMPDPRFYAPGSAARGTASHSAVALYLAAKAAKRDPAVIEAWRQELHPLIRPRFDAFLLFEKASKFRAEAWEILVHNPIYRYAGRLDLLCRLGGSRGERWILDIKTGPPAPWHALQSAAYAACRKEKRNRASLHLTKEGDYRFVPHDGPGDLRMFLAAVPVAAWRRNHGLIPNEGGNGDGDGNGRAEAV